MNSVGGIFWSFLVCISSVTEVIEGCFWDYPLSSLVLFLWIECIQLRATIFFIYILGVSHIQLLCLHFCRTSEMHSFSAFKGVFAFILLHFFRCNTSELLILNVVLVHNAMKYFSKSTAIYFLITKYNWMTIHCTFFTPDINLRFLW